MRAWCVPLLLGLLVPGLVWADWVQYDTSTPAAACAGSPAVCHLVTGYHPSLRPADRAGRGVLETVGTPVWPVVDACAGRPDWTVITQLTPLTLAVRQGVRCLDDEDTPDLTEAQRIKTILNQPICRVNSQADLDAALPTGATLAQNTAATRQLAACLAAIRRRIQQ